MTGAVDAVNVAGIVLLFVATFTAVLREMLPRTVALLLAATLAVAFGTTRGFFTAEAAIASISVQTLILLATMSVVAGVLAEAGAFEYVAITIARLTAGRRAHLFIAIGMVTYVFSTVANNVTVTVIMGSLTIGLLTSLRINPMPFMVAVLISSNTGGASTAIGDFPNLVIADRGGIPFLDFIGPLGMLPIAFVCQVTVLGFLRWQFRAELSDRDDLLAELARQLPLALMQRRRAIVITSQRALLSGALALVVALVLFASSAVHGLTPFEVAIAALVIALVGSGLDQEAIIDAVGLRTLLAFVGLFVLAGAAEHTRAIDALAEALIELTGGDAILVVLALPLPIAIATALVDAGPTTAVFVGLVADLEQRLSIPGHLGMWSLSLGVLAGSSATILGATAGTIAAAQMDGWLRRTSPARGAARPIRTGFAARFSRSGIPSAAIMLTPGIGFLFMAYKVYRP